MVQVIFGLGSNVGDRRAMLDAAVRMLAQQLGAVRRSSLYESRAVLLPGAPAAWDMPYLNMAATAEAEQAPEALLGIAKRIEQALGRKDRGRWGPREIDVDILVCGGAVLDTPQLKIPHPELLNRDFALVPLAEVAPEWVYPGSARTARDLAAGMGANLKRMAA